MVKIYSIQIIELIDKLIELINKDIEELGSANSDNLMKRNEQKQVLVNDIKIMKNNLDSALKECVKSGNNIEQFRDIVNMVESKLEELKQRNNQLAYIMLPLKEMYDNIIKDLLHNDNMAVNFSA